MPYMTACSAFDPPTHYSKDICIYKVSCWVLWCPAHLIELLLKNFVPLSFEHIWLNVANVKYKFYHVCTVYLLLHNT